MNALPRIAAGALPLAVAVAVALSLGPTAAGKASVPTGSASALANEITGTLSCTGTTCQATMTNNFPAGTNPIQGFYLRGTVRLSGLSITSDQAAGADCASFQGPGGSPECFLNHDHYWQTGTSLSVTFTRASAFRIPSGRSGIEFSISIGLTFNQASYYAVEFVLALAKNCLDQLELVWEERGEVAALEEEQSAAEAYYAAAKANLQSALTALHGASGPEIPAAVTAVQLAVIAVGLADAWAEDVFLDLRDEDLEVAAAEAALNRCLGVGAIRITGAAQPSTHAACDNQAQALGTARGKAEILADGAKRYAATKLAPADKRLRSAIVALTRAAKSPKAKKAKPKLLRAIAAITKADAVIAPVVTKSAGLAGEAKAAADDTTKAQAALDTCQKG
jgi:hypothetical protein